MRVQEGWLARRAVREELLAAASQLGLESGVRHGAARDTAYRAQGMEPLLDVTQSSLGGTWSWHGLMVMLGHDPKKEKASSVCEALRVAGHATPPSQHTSWAKEAVTVLRTRQEATRGAVSLVRQLERLWEHEQSIQRVIISEQQILLSLSLIHI